MKLPILFTVIGLILLTLAGYFAFDTHNFLKNATLTSGVVIDLKEEVSTTDGHRSVSYRPVITFKTATNDTIIFSADVATNPPSYQMGEETMILYEPEDPRDARINTTFQLWFLPIF